MKDILFKKIIIEVSKEPCTSAEEKWKVWNFMNDSIVYHIYGSLFHLPKVGVQVLWLLL